jgi:hypothetical protein
MPARDAFHNTVKQALIKDGWTVTHDPLRLVWGKREFFVDLGAERLLAAEKGGDRIAVEVKSFLGPSDMRELETAIGQFIIYESVLRRVAPERKLYLAVRQSIFRSVFEEPIGMLMRDDHDVRLLVFDEQAGEIVRWIA